MDSAIYLLNNQTQARRKEFENERAQRLKCRWYTQLEWTRGLSPEKIKSSFKNIFPKRGGGGGGEDKGDPPDLNIPIAMTTHTEKFQVLN